MSAPGTQTARGARDTLAGLLGLGVPYPLRDLELDFAKDVPNGLTADILIRAAQAGVSYQLCTEEGKPVEWPAGKPIRATLSADHGGEPARADTPVFLPGDLRDAAALLRQLSPTATGVGALLRKQLRPETLALLDAASGGNDEAVQDALLEDLNKIVRQSVLYDADAFRDVCLSPWTSALLRQLQATDPRQGLRLNRFLVEDAFPLALWRTLALTTPPISEDVTFTILASREKAGVFVETPLAASASIRAGIAASLAVYFPATGGHTAVVPYGGTPEVAVDDSQEGISYQLVSTKDPAVKLSDPQVGNRITVKLTVNVPLKEDTGITVKAYRTSAPNPPTFLTTVLQVNVGPDPAVTVQVDPAIVDFHSAPRFSLVSAQASAQYTLWQRPVAPADYAPPGGVPRPSVPVFVPVDPAVKPPWFGFVGAPTVVNGQPQFALSVLVPDLGDGRQVPAEFLAAGEFTVTGGVPQVTADALQEDALFLVLAKKQNGESLVLNRKVAVLVRPDPQPSLAAAASPVMQGTPGLVLVGNAQKGVRYRLLRDADGAPVLNPGYHHDDRVLETARLETDFMIEAQGEPVIALPTEPLDAATKFRVVAIKNATALTAPLKATVAIAATPPQTGGPLFAPPAVAVPAPVPPPTSNPGSG